MAELVGIGYMRKVVVKTLRASAKRRELFSDSAQAV